MTEDTMRSAVLAGLLAIPFSAFADQVLLKGGGELNGVVVERTTRGIVMEVGPGRISLPHSRIEGIVAGPSLLGTFRERLSRISPGDVAGLVRLGLWAQEHELLTQSRELFERVLALDPENAAAHRALGHLRVGEHWMTREESFRAQGLVPFEGTWVTTAEREAILRERAEAEATERARVEAAARAREAEARARQAEAEARQAELALREREQAITAPAFVVGSVGFGGFGPRVVGFDGFPPAVSCGLFSPCHPPVAPLVVKQSVVIRSPVVRPPMRDGPRPHAGGGVRARVSFDRP